MSPEFVMPVFVVLGSVLFVLGWAIGVSQERKTWRHWTECDTPCKAWRAISCARTDAWHEIYRELRR